MSTSLMSMSTCLCLHVLLRPCLYPAIPGFLDFRCNIIIPTQMCIFFFLIRISYQSTSGVESESPEKLRGRSRIVLLLPRILQSRRRSVVRSFVHYRSVIPNSLPSFHRHSSFVIRRSFVVHLPDYCKPRISSES